MDATQTIAATTAAATEVMAPSCFDQLYGFDLNLGKITGFDQNRGLVILTEGSTCFDQLRQGVSEIADFVKEQLAMVSGEDLSQATAAVVEDATAAIEESTGISQLIDSVYDYTDGQMVLSMWSWEKWHVIPGESVGVCIQPAEDDSAYASCWEWTMDEQGYYENTHKNYLVNPLYFQEQDFTLDQAEPLSGASIPALFGNWICVAPHERWNKIETFCGRLLPKTESVTDPAYIDGESVKVSTYLTSRSTGRISAAAPVNGNEAFYSESSGFVAFDIIMDNATNYMFDSASTIATSVVGLTAAIVTLNF